LPVDTGTMFLVTISYYRETKTGIAEDVARNTTPKSGIATAIPAIAVPAPMNL